MKLWFHFIFLFAVGAHSIENSKTRAAELRVKRLERVALQLTGPHLHVRVTGPRHAGAAALSLPSDSVQAKQETREAGDSALHQSQPARGADEFQSCIVLAVVGSVFGFWGLSLCWYLYKAREEMEAIIGDASRSATAKITSKRHYVTTNNQVGTDHYVASYRFEGVRGDGMRCGVIAREREQPQSYWETLEVDQDEPVLYAVDDPGQCRLKSAAELDHAEARSSSGVISLGVRTLFCLVLLAVGFCVGVVGSAFCGFNASGIIGACFCSCLWFVLVGSCFGLAKPHIESKATRGSAIVSELGLQAKSADLGDISGLWLLESELGRFEYVFSTVSATIVKVKGRPQGRDRWDSEREGHFAGARGVEMVWVDEDDSHFCVAFDGPDAFTGSFRNAAGKKFGFKGSRY